MVWVVVIWCLVTGVITVGLPIVVAAMELRGNPAPETIRATVIFVMLIALALYLDL